MSVPLRGRRDQLGRRRRGHGSGAASRSRTQPAPGIRFCTASDGARIAYSAVGNGPPLVKAANWLNHLEYEWESPVWKHWIDEISRRHVFVRYDERGCGLSDWHVQNQSFEAWVRDLETVVDALGLEHFDLLGISQGGAVAVAYAARHPGRVNRLILFGAYARGWQFRDDAAEIEARTALIRLTRLGWGRNNPAFRQIFTTRFVPDAGPEQMEWFNELQLVSASPENAARLMEDFRGSTCAPCSAIFRRRRSSSTANTKPESRSTRGACSRPTSLEQGLFRCRAAIISCSRMSRPGRSCFENSATFEWR